MARITSVNARYSGMVTFTDQTKEYFHCQMEDDMLWSIDADGSHSAQEKICWTRNDAGGYPFYTRQNLLWRNGLRITGADLDTSFANVDKRINGVVFHGEVLFALDDNTNWPSSMSYDPHYGYQWTNGGTITPDNLQEYIDKIEAMLLQIFDYAILVV